MENLALFKIFIFYINFVISTFAVKQTFYLTFVIISENCSYFILKCFKKIFSLCKHFECMIIIYCLNVLDLFSEFVTDFNYT